MKFYHFFLFMTNCLKISTANCMCPFFPLVDKISFIILIFMEKKQCECFFICNQKWVVGMYIDLWLSQKVNSRTTWKLHIFCILDFQKTKIPKLINCLWNVTDAHFGMIHLNNYAKARIISKRVATTIKNLLKMAKTLKC